MIILTPAPSRLYSRSLEYAENAEMNVLSIAVEGTAMENCSVPTTSGK